MIDIDDALLQLRRLMEDLFQALHTSASARVALIEFVGGFVLEHLFR